ncbi:radical SAM protein [Pseudomonas monteilii]|uniref:radical SAM protein n=1 Tax=Pseudomonas monteilii TaxID=76759 RepID=UPI0036E54065
MFAAKCSAVAREKGGGMAKLKLSKYICATVTGDAGVTIFSTRSGALYTVCGNDWEALSRNNFEEVLSRETIEILSEASILVDADEDELSSILHVAETSIENDSVLDVVITPTAQCTLGCNMPELGGYCGQDHKNELMSDSVINGLCAQVERLIQDKHRRLLVSWFGGEPLLAVSVIRRITEKLLVIARDHKLSYQATLTTGGTLLTAPMATILYSEMEIKSVSLTIDGPQYTHDMRRCTKSGKPTFETIVENIDSILISPNLARLKLALRCNVDSRNIEDVDRLIDYIEFKGWLPRIDVYFAMVHPWGERSNKEFSIDTAGFAKKEIEWLERLILLGGQPELLPQVRTFVCRVVTPGRIVFGHDGLIHRCTETPLARISTFDDVVGTVKSVLPLPVSYRPWNWLGEIKNGRYPCSSCEMLPICGGGCPLSWSRGSDVPCPSFKYNLKDRISLQLNSEKYRADACGELAEPHIYSAVGMAKIFFGGSSEEYKCLELLDEKLSVVRAQLSQGFHRNAKTQLQEFSRERSRYASNYMARKFFNVMIENTKSYLFYKEGDHNKLRASVINSLGFLASISRNFDGVDVRPAQIQVLLNYASSCAQINPAVIIVHEIEKYLRDGERLKLDVVTLRPIEKMTKWENDRALFLEQVQEIKNQLVTSR